MQVRRTFIITSLLAVVIFAGTVVAAHYFSFFQTNKAEAQGAGYALNGYAWSDTIGWIQMENVSLSWTDGQTLTGYAWSDNIGWVSFNQSDLSGCPSGTCSAKLVNGALQGWARACAGTVNGDCTGASRTDGWDGWISLSGPGYGPSLPANQSFGSFSGYAWGSDIVGWIDFSNVALGTPIGPNTGITFTANPSRVLKNATTTLAWTANSMTGCGITGSNGTIPAPYSPANGTDGNHSVVATITGSTIYTLVCSSASGTSTASVSVGLLPTYIEK